MMRHSTVFTTLILLFWCLGCEKDDAWGELNMLKDGQRWEGDEPRAGSSGYDENLFHISTNRTIDSQFDLFDSEMSITGIPEAIGKYRLQPFDPPKYTTKDTCCIAYFTYAGHNQLEGLYTIQENDPDAYVEITEIKKGKIKGIFSAVLLLNAESKKSFPHLKDTLVITEGYFHVRLKD